MIAVIIPTLNEEESIREVIEGFPDTVMGEKLEVYVVDGGSTDRTVEIAEESSATVMHQRLAGGKGDALRESLESIDADIYVTIDGDGTYDPAELEKLLKPIKEGGAGHVIGSRSRRENGSIPALNLVGNKLFNLMARLSTGKDVRDMLSGYRAFTRESLRYTDFTRPGFGIETEMTLSALENNVRVEEVPISYGSREGESKLNPVMDGYRILKTLTWCVRDVRPLRFFSTISGLLLVLASYPGYLTVMQKLQQGQITNLGPALFASFLVIVAVQLLIFGLLADQIKNVEKRLNSRV